MRVGGSVGAGGYSGRRDGDDVVEAVGAKSTRPTAVSGGGVLAGGDAGNVVEAVEGVTDDPLVRWAVCGLAWWSSR